jgi:phosphopantothenoylcysteine decarboxylase/phosphopantothenate--cysteine ligase
MIVANLVGGSTTGFGADTNQVTMFYRDGSREKSPLMEKGALAHLVLDRIRDRILSDAVKNESTPKN